MESQDQEEAAVLDHLRAAKAIGDKVSIEGRYEDSWQVYKNSAKSAMAAAPGSPTSRQLGLAMSLARQQHSPAQRASTMRRAIGVVLEPGALPDSPSSVASSSRPATPGTTISLGRSGSAPALMFSGSLTADGWRTSHYTKHGAPRTNSHYDNTLRGGNKKFHGVQGWQASDREFFADGWRTSNEAFFEDSAKYALTPPKQRDDPNFQYVNGDKRQGLSTWQKSALPGYWRTHAEGNATYKLQQP
eukprot:TRINITY_DN35763_c0_g1_i2.p1 TRINITY_DN35763_c0_g1~~TRINITY_DN35763_c0_g1_i2.p1  ORF type:complete len:245 (-),score=49.41 TRINITY_DN35763_c0_g1_i2:217-951(-)